MSMQPLNNKERNSAFWGFVLFFSLVSTVITLTVYFNLLVPKQFLSELKEKEKEFNAINSKQKSIMAQIDSINAEFKLYNSPNPNLSFLQNDISRKNIALESSLGTESPTNRLFFRIVNNYKAMLIIKHDLGESEMNFNKVKSDLNNCQRDNTAIEKELKEKSEKNNK